ncbi:MAG: flavin reductase family protein [Halieaceae bacterium]|jgi:flavin reductase (DIM6/NTAB) family NADH-FMN oxidoreductase RutF|nr:flavin reductase family protein [Halieaceae bacterium]
MISISGEDIAAMDDRYRVFFVNALSGLKPAHLIGTTNGEGKHNLALFSSVVHIGAHPPLLGMISRPHSVPRHTLENIHTSGCYSINHVRPDFFEAAHQTAARYEDSEFDAVGLTPAAGSLAAPYVAESLLSIGLEHRETVDLAINGTHLVIGEVVEVRLPEACLGRDGAIDLARAGGVVVGGLDHYYGVTPLARMHYAKPDRPPRRMTQEEQA